MNKIKILGAFCIILLSFFVVKEKVLGYSCLPYTCSTVGGVLRGYWVEGGIYVCQIANRTYTCSGVDSNCSGGITYYDTYNDCINGDNARFQGCCSGGSSGGGDDCNTSCSLCSAVVPVGYTGNIALTSCRSPNTIVKTCKPSGGCCAKKTFYLLETNTTPSMPSSVSILVDNIEYALSTNPATPTMIKVPSSNDSDVTKVQVPEISAPSTSSGVGASFKAYNDGVNGEWSAIAGCSGVAGEDFCSESWRFTQYFQPTTKTTLEVLKENAVGKIAGMYYTINKCDTTKKYSLPIEGYYVVDNIPTTDISIDTNDKTAKNCTSNIYTGLEINNPLPFHTTTTDLNGNDEVQALIIWFSKDTSVPKIVNISGSITESNVNDFGIMIRKNGATWDSPLIYSTNTDNTWRIIQATDKLAITNLSISQTTQIDISFDLEFKVTTTNPSGLYNVYGGALDSYMIHNGIDSNFVDQSKLLNRFVWGIDLVNPTVDDIILSTNDINSTFLQWNSTDLQSSIAKVIINAYKTGGTNTDDVEMFTPPTYLTSKGSVLLNTLPPENEIGLFDDSNAWIFNNTSTQRDLLNINENEGGNINIYVSAYDLGCNTNSKYENINLNPWMTAYGGAIYSQGGITNSAKDVSSVVALDGVFRNLDKLNLDTGTELISSSNAILPDLIHPSLGAVKALSIYDSNDRKNFWFEHLKERFDSEKNPLATEIPLPTSACPSGICYVYSTEDININAGFVCSAQILVMSEKDIHIQPDITSSSTNTGCIFLAKGNIDIGAGQYKTGMGPNIQYDYMDSFLIAQGKIEFELVDELRTLRDGIEINGGLVAFGNEINSGSSINIARNLKLLNSTNPTVVNRYDNKYSNIAAQFFGLEAPIYKQEIGFKSF